MPRYFFSQHIADRVIQDYVGLDLPEPRPASEGDRAAVLWANILAERSQPGRILVITDALGQMLFVTAR
jgi:hypothetical protein